MSDTPSAQQRELYNCHSDYDMMYKYMNHTFHESTSRFSLAELENLQLGGRPSSAIGIITSSVTINTFSLRGSVIIDKYHPFKLSVIVFATATAYIVLETKNNIIFSVDISVYGKNVTIEQKLVNKTFLKKHAPAATSGYYNTDTFDTWRPIGIATFTLPRPYDLEPLQLQLRGEYRIGESLAPAMQLEIFIPIHVVQNVKDNTLSPLKQSRYYSSPKYYENPTKRLCHGR